MRHLSSIPRAVEVKSVAEIWGKQGSLRTVPASPRYPTFVMPPPFNTVPYTAVTPPNHNITLLLLHNSKF